jgi:tetratricopeptide (TPR) repeat protein
MPKKKIVDTTPIEQNPVPEETTPIRFKKNLFKEKPAAVDTTPFLIIKDPVENSKPTPGIFKKNLVKAKPASVEPTPVLSDINQEESKPIDQKPTLIGFIKNLFKSKPRAVEPTPVPGANELTPVPVVDEPVDSSSEEKVKKPRRGKWIWIGILAMLLIAAIGAVIGYSSGIKERKLAEVTQRQVDAVTQFELGRQDMIAGRLEMAKQRFVYVLTIYPEYPGIDEELKKVMIAIALNPNNSSATESPKVTPQPKVTPVATKDTRELSVLLKQAQEQLAASDWQGLLTTVDLMRNIDPKYEPFKVDGLYYFALRNVGIIQIESGNLEIGLYDFALASQIAPIDEYAEARRGWAKLYITAASWWGVNWQKASTIFAQLYSMGLELRDSSGINVTRRYSGSLEGYGDFLQSTGAWCDAVKQYEIANGIYSTQSILDKLPTANELCANPPTPTPTVTPTVGPNYSTPTPAPN